MEDFFGFKQTRKPSINSKAKGNANELHACKRLQEWTGEKFVRTPMSGGYRRINSMNLAGDIYPDTLNSGFYFPFTVETKALKNLYVPPVLRLRSEIYTIFKQSHRDSKRSEQYPFVMVRAKNMPVNEYYIVLERSMGGDVMGLFIKPISYGAYTDVDLQQDLELVVFKFSDVKTVSYKKFIKYFIAIVKPQN